MKKNEILKIYGTEYKDMTLRLLTESGLSDMIPGKDACICVKPNLVTPSPASFGATTHPEIVEGIIEYLRSNGFGNIVIAEGSWIGDRTQEAFEYCGYNAISEKYGVRLIDTKKDKAVPMDCAGQNLSVCSFLNNIDFLINVPVLKGHSQTGITCALKNLKGIIPDSEKRRFHSMGLHRPIAHLNAGVRQDFIVVDHICGDPEIEDGGHPLVRNCIMAALDPVLTDAYTCSLLDCPPKRAAYIGLAESLGVGSADLSALKIRTIGGIGEESLPENFRRIDFGDNVSEVESCSACYTNLVEALDRLHSEGRLEGLNEKICIGQGFKGKKGYLGVGSCTSGFTHHLKGCPAESEEIYRFLYRLLS